MYCPCKVPSIFYSQIRACLGSVCIQVKKYTEDDMNALLSGEGKLFGKVVKKGMLPTEKWYFPVP